MRTARLASLACLTLLCAPLAMADQFDWFRSKAKAGMYEYKVDMDMSGVAGLPPGMGKQSHTFQHCVTQQDIDKGQMNKGREGSENNDCEIKNLAQSGSSATYTMSCTKPRPMQADVKIAFAGDGYQMDMKMNMADRSGKAMNMVQHMEARYLGACNK